MEPRLTRQQEMAKRAHECVKGFVGSDKEKEYARFAKQFPALIHTCGLCQSVAFADAKGNKDHVKHLATVMGNPVADFQDSIRKAEAVHYMRLNRLALQAASWLKRYAEALLKDED